MSAFAWPSAFVILGIIFMIVFKGSIANFLSRVREVNRTGIKTSIEQPTDSPLARASSVEEALRSFDSPILKEREEAIIRNTKTRGLIDAQEANRVLVRHLAILQIIYGYELIDKYIYGSQLELLRNLNAMPRGESAENLKVFYNVASTGFPNVYKEYSFDSWLGFLQNMGLISLQGGRYIITPVGRDFLGYLVAVGRTGYRSF